ncbi:MAG TPA: NAD kinase [Crocinitomix sp.]|nr:NAD kinase [Crocinitomix sp.]
MKVAIYGRSFDNSFSVFVQELIDIINDYNWGITFYEPYFSYLKPRLTLGSNIETFKKHKDIKDSVDLMISIGGDGTFLETIHLVRDSGIPILGVNAGRLGFLASTQKEDIKAVLQQIKEGKYRLQKRSILKLNNELDLFEGENYALNELVVHKKDSSSMITIHTYIDDLFLNSYWADGLIIATPTGSTAYSLSCGGPILVPGVRDFVITPIAPHNLNVRPVVVPDSRRITLKIEGRSKEFLCAMDSRSVPIDSSMELVITKANFMINIIQTENQNFLNTIRRKMYWGADERN